MPEPLDLYVEIAKADGTRYRWDGSGLAANIPTGISFTTKRQDGFSTASCVLSRQIDLEHVDIELGDEFTILSAAGEVRFHGRVSAAPRSLDAEGHSIQVEATGYMAAAKDRKFVGVYADRDFAQWQEPSLLQRANRGAAGITQDKDYSVSSERGLAFTGSTGQAISNNSVASRVYRMPDGDLLSKIMYIGTQVNTTNVEAAALLTDSDPDMGSTASTALTLDGTLRTATPTAAEQYAELRAKATGTHTPGVTAPFTRTFTQLAVYGNHGLTLRAISGEPSGLYASDVMQHIVESYTPLTWAGNDSDYPIPHLAFRELTHPYDALLACNAFHIWDLACWEDRKVYWQPTVTDDWDWEIPLDQKGTTVRWEGDSDEDLANGIVVEYTHLPSGATKILYPTDHAELRDDDPLNPANSHGEKRWTDAKLPSPATEDMALQIGRILLGEFNLPKHPGAYTLGGGYVRDRQGNLQPGSKVRAGERALVTSSTTAQTRVIGETSWAQDSRTLTVATDGPIRRMDAYNDRVAAALQANNLQ